MFTDLSHYINLYLFCYAEFNVDFIRFNQSINHQKHIDQKVKKSALKNNFFYIIMTCVVAVCEQLLVAIPQKLLISPKHDSLQKHHPGKHKRIQQVLFPSHPRKFSFYLFNDLLSWFISVWSQIWMMYHLERFQNRNSSKIKARASEILMTVSIATCTQI